MYLSLAILYATIEGVALITINPQDCIMAGFSFMLLVIVCQDAAVHYKNL